ncbi:efflux transporter outer membrane subunit [Paraburkholderia sp. SOS3]|jgi:NodT family efflux transporter outer membrane factor (OMF) lipoprotein|uniref:efflux transporter outer membrane subunit n=1 Tax=Paraburkholderia sp. SOS3 TaxID=1926494 RepID=UPI000947609C|nr:efflux transporter outer membrane subunit [Paraburkholderia sp. SOS3]APR39258.1 RND transporter [Paraburkholderia sp. SOS3]
MLRASPARAVWAASGAIVATVAALSIAGCAVGPDFSRPPAPRVDQFVNGAAPATTLAAAGATQVFRPGAPVRNDWWTLFGCRAIDVAVDETLTGNQTLAAAQATLRRSEHELRAGAGIFFPQVDAQFSASRQRFAPLRSGIDVPSSIFNLFTLSATVSYALDIWGGERRQVEALAAQTEAQRYAVAAAYLTLSANVVNTMIARAAYRDEIAATEEMVALVGQQIDITNAQVIAGASAYSAVVTLENERATLEASVPALAQKEAQADDLLALLAGQFPSEWHAPPVSLADIAVPADLPQTLPSTLVRRRPDILQAEAALHVASANVGVATAALFPNITLSASGGFDNTSMHSLTDSSGRVWSIGAGIVAPLFQGGTLWHQRKAALAAFDESNAGYRQTVLAAFAQVADTLRALEHDAAALDAQTRAVDAAGEALRLLKTGYEAGTVGYLEILIADRQYHEARIAWLQASAQRLQDTVALYAALGGGWNEEPPAAAVPISN